MKDLTRRLAKLEGSVADTLMRPDPEAARAARIQTAILACWKGNYDGCEALASAHSRALGYVDCTAYKVAFLSPDTDVIERHNRVWSDFIAEHEISPNSPQDEVDAFFAMALQRVPERIQQSIVDECARLENVSTWGR